MALSYHGWLAILITLAVFLTLLLRRGAPIDLTFLAGLTAATFTGVVTPQQALAGFSNSAVLMIGALFVVAAGLRSTGALDIIGERLLGQARTDRQALLRLAPVLVSHGLYINNTPLVAMVVPVVIDWCRKFHISPSRLLIPVSYLAVLGGTCTLIGTSPNLVMNGLMLSEYEHRKATAVDPAELRHLESLRGMSFFEIGYVGIPCALVGVLYLLLIGRRQLPNRTDLIETLGDQRREYLVEMRVDPDCRLAGQTVERAGLRNLPGLFLIEIDRQGEIITPVTPRDVMAVGDRLVFTGVVSTIIDLEKIPGLRPAADSTYVTEPQGKRQRHLTEAVLSNTSPLIGCTIKEAKFRQLYNAAVVAVHRNGERMTNKIGSIQLEAGDTLLLQTSSEFVNNFRHSRDFYLVSGVEGSQPRRHDRVWISVALLVVLVLFLTLTNVPQVARWIPSGGMAIAAIAVAVAMVATRCLSISEARNSIDMQVMLAIFAALGLGTAMSESGAAAAIAHTMVGLVGSSNPYLLLILIYCLAVILTEMITNAAVVALMFPLAVALAQQGGHSPRPFVMAIALAASCSFATPFGYQTNLMVMGPGGYKPIDYLRVGVPLTFVVGITSLLLIPIVWPFAL